MGRTRTPVVAAQEILTAETLLSFWKLSFVEPSVGNEYKLQADLGSRRRANCGRGRPQQPQESESCVGKHTRGGRTQEKQLQRYLQHQEEVKDEDDKVGLEDIQVSGKAGHQKVGSSAFIALLKARTIEKDLQRDRGIHAQRVSGRLLENSLKMTTSMSMYSEYGALEMAEDLFRETCFRNVVPWNMLIDWYIHHAHAHLVLTCFEQTQQEHTFPDAVTCAYILKACGTLGVLKKGEEFHCQLVSNSLLEKDNFVGTVLVDMYTTCGSFREAEEVCDNLVVWDLDSWNALILGYVHHRHDGDAIGHFERMQHEELFPNAVTFICNLKACGSLGVSFQGQAVHAEILRARLLAKAHIGNCLLNMYANCDFFAKAQEVFVGLSVQDVVSLSALVPGWGALHFHPEEAWNSLEGKWQEGSFPNRYIVLSELRTCGSNVLWHKGQEIHARIMKEGWLTKDVRIACALVDMYAKCGVLPKAQEVFDELPGRNDILWTALITGYAHSGKFHIAFKLFKNMIDEGQEPSSVAFTNLLNACSSGGLLEEGQMVFEVLRGHHGMIPTLAHYTRMVDLFSRAGDLEKAATFISEMPFSPDRTVWHFLLGACLTYGDTIWGRWAFEHAVQLNEHDSTAYVLMSNIYKAARRGGSVP